MLKYFYLYTIRQKIMRFASSIREIRTFEMFCVFDELIGITSSLLGYCNDHCDGL